MPERATIGQTIRTLREERCLTVYRLALLAGIKSETGLHRIEQDLTDPKTSTLVRIARALGVSLAVFDGTRV